PDMFSSILKEIQHSFPETDLDRLIYYFQRHIELDGDEHGPLALKMIEELAKDDPQKWADIQSVSKLSLQKRVDLWDAILENILIYKDLKIIRLIKFKINTNTVLLIGVYLRVAVSFNTH